MSENKHTIGDLRQMQSLPLDAKIRMTEYRIREWYDAWYGNVYVSFSGGKDSTVLLHIARRLYPDIEAVFIDTGLEFPSVRKFAMSQENVTVLRPKMNFRDVVIKYGYPIINKEISGKAEEVRNSIKNGNIDTVRYRQFMGLEKKDNGQPSEFNCEHYKFLLYAPFKLSDKCCEVMKKNSIKRYETKNHKKPFIGQMAEESRNRLNKWIKNGCNAFELKHPQSNPMSFWTENDVLTYIHTYGLQIAGAYGDVVVENKGIAGQINVYDMLGDYSGCKFCTTGCKRTGCIFCLFGIKKDLGRILRLQKDVPKLADYVLRGGEFYEDGMWKPNNHGMGYWFVLDWLALHNIEIPYENAEHYRETYGNERTAELLKGDQ